MMPSEFVQTVSRRAVLMGVAASVAASGLLPPRVSAEVGGYDPRLSAEGQIKINGALDGSPAFWRYSGVLYAVLPRLRPKPLLAVSGCQANWAERQADGSYRVAAPLLSFFRDLGSGDFLDHFDNPFTGERNEVRPNMFLGGGHALYPPDGSAMRIVGSPGASESAPQGFKTADSSVGIGRVDWSLTHDTVILDTDQFFEVKTQPQAEAQTRTADRRAFFDRRVARLPARFTATTISPWLGWMNMGEAEGHLVWHTFGDKVFSLDALTQDYRAHAGGLLDQLAMRPAS